MLARHQLLEAVDRGVGMGRMTRQKPLMAPMGIAQHRERPKVTGGTLVVRHGPATLLTSVAHSAMVTGRAGSRGARFRVGVGSDVRCLSRARAISHSPHGILGFKPSARAL
jgi:hypothetical protein